MCFSSLFNPRKIWLYKQGCHAQLRDEWAETQKLGCHPSVSSLARNREFPNKFQWSHGSSFYSDYNIFFEALLTNLVSCSLPSYLTFLKPTFYHMSSPKSPIVNKCSSEGNKKYWACELQPSIIYEFCSPRPSRTAFFSGTLGCSPSQPRFTPLSPGEDVIPLSMPL